MSTSISNYGGNKNITHSMLTAWGMTELGPLATVGHVKENKGKPDSSGIVLPNTQLKVIDFVIILPLWLVKAT